MQSASRHFNVKTASRGIDSVALEYDLFPNELAFNCDVEQSTAGLFWSTWEVVPNVRWQTVGDTSDQSTTEVSDKVPCVAYVPGLLQESEYTFRVVVKSEDQILRISVPHVCRTADRPQMQSAAILVAKKTARTLTLQLAFSEPEDNPVQECEVQYCREDAVFSGWLNGTGFVVDTEIAPAETSRVAARWSGTLSELEGATTYRLRFRARNMVGWSSSFSMERVFRTSDVPTPPTDLVFLSRQPNLVTIGFHIKHPEGAPVTSFKAEVQGTFAFDVWRQTVFQLRNQDQLDCETVRLCILNNLEPETEYYVRLWCKNEVGCSTEPSAVIRCKTSEFPKAPKELRTKLIGPQSVEVEWDLADPVGAPILKCNLEYICENPLGSGLAVIGAEEMQGAGSATQMEAVNSNANICDPWTPDEARIRLWKFRLDGLQRESTFTMQVLAQNSIGWSPKTAPKAVIKTTDTPPSPSCILLKECFPTAVTLEISVPELTGFRPVTHIEVERSGVVSWQDMKVLECCKISVDLKQKAVTKLGEQDDAKLQPNVVSVWRVKVFVGISPRTPHSLRAWAVNEYGRCLQPSATCICETAPPPKPPFEIVQMFRLPHAVILEWRCLDVENAPTRRCEVEQYSMLSITSWQTASCADCQRVDLSGDRWRCMIEELQPGSTYRFRMRGRNESGCSEWYDAGAGFVTSETPTKVSSLHAKYATEEWGEGDVAVDFEIDDPQGAPTVACLVQLLWPNLGLQVRAQRIGHSSPGHWQALFRDLGTLRMQDLSFGIRAANCTGWGAFIKLGHGDPAPQDDGGPAVSVIELLCREVPDALKELRTSQDRMQALHDEALLHEDPNHITLLDNHKTKLKRRIEALQEIARRMGASQDEIVAPPDEGAFLAQELKKLLQAKVFVPTYVAAVDLLFLFFKGHKWLDLVLEEKIEPKWSEIMQLMETGQNRDDSAMLSEWVMQHDKWVESFERRLITGLSEGLSSAARVVATLVTGGKLELLESARHYLAVYHALILASEKRLRHYGSFLKMLRSADDADDQKQRSLRRRSMCERLGHDALAMFSMGMPPVGGGLSELNMKLASIVWKSSGVGGDAGQHLAMEHPSGDSLEPILRRLGCSDSTLEGVFDVWSNDIYQDAADRFILVHNATARRLTVRALQNVDSWVNAATETLSDTFASVIAVEEKVRRTVFAVEEKVRGITIPPTDVALLQVDSSPAAKKSGRPPTIHRVRRQDYESRSRRARRRSVVDGEDLERPSIRLEFSYGPAACREETIGKANISLGSALSFVSLDTGLQVSNCEDSVSEGAIEIVNNDLADVTVNISRPTEERKSLSAAVSTHTLSMGEEKEVALPRMQLGRILEVEVRHECGTVRKCDVQPGQRVVVNASI